MFGFVKNVLLFFAGLAISLTLMGVNLMSCISLNNQESKVGPQIANVISDEPVFFPFMIKINIGVVVTILMIHMQKFVFLML